MRDERGKSIEFNLDRQARVLELKMRQWVLRGEFSRRNAAQTRVSCSNPGRPGLHTAAKCALPERA